MKIYLKHALHVVSVIGVLARAINKVVVLVSSKYNLNNIYTLSRCNSPVAALQQGRCGPTTPKFCSYLSVLHQCNSPVAPLQQPRCAVTTAPLRRYNSPVAPLQQPRCSSTTGQLRVAAITTAQLQLVPAFRK